MNTVIEARSLKGVPAEHVVRTQVFRDMRPACTGNLRSFGTCRRRERWRNSGRFAMFHHREAGEVIGIVGQNGAGKSTLLKILSRIVEPTQGEVRMRGRVASLLEVGTGFHPELTGRENIFLSGSILGMKKREIVSQFDAIVAFAEIERFLDTRSAIRSGMYVRLPSLSQRLATEIPDRG